MSYVERFWESRSPLARGAILFAAGVLIGGIIF